MLKRLNRNKKRERESSHAISFSKYNFSSNKKIEAFMIYDAAVQLRMHKIFSSIRYALHSLSIKSNLGDGGAKRVNC